VHVHPISSALRYLKGQRSLRGAPYYGQPAISSEAEAAQALRQLTGQDFGTDGVKWGSGCG
jgi:hypothetical protein